MGLLPSIISSQKNLMKKSKSNYETLKNYMDNLTKYMDEIKDVWPMDAGERIFIFNTLNSAGKEIANICSGYKTYTVNVNNLLDLLKDFLDFMGVKTTSGYSFSKVSVSKSTKTKVLMDTVRLRSCGKKIYSLGQKIEEIELDYKNIASKVDDTVSNILQGKVSSLGTLNRKLDKQALNIMKVGNAITVICDKYELAEKNIAKKVLDIEEGKPVTYGDGTPSSAKLQKKEGGSYNLPTMSNYNISKSIIVDVSRKYPIKTRVYSSSKKNVSGKYNMISSYDFFVNNIENNGKYDQYNKEEYGNISSWWNGKKSVGCTATSLGVLLSIVSGKNIDPANYWTSNGVYYQNNYKISGETYKKSSWKSNNHSQQELRTVIYDRIVAKGQPVLIRNGSNTHTVVAIGIKDGVDPSNVKNSDILVYDPVFGVTTYDKTQEGNSILNLNYYTKQ